MVIYSSDSGLNSLSRRIKTNIFMTVILASLSAKFVCLCYKTKPDFQKKTMKNFVHTTEDLLTS